jgi:hypothetical protein
VLSLKREDVLRSDAEKNRQEKQVVVMRIVQQQGDRNAADICAQGNDPFVAEEQPMQEHVQGAAGDDGQQDLGWASIEAKYRTAKNGVQGEQRGERNSRVFPSGEDPRGGVRRLHGSNCALTHACLQASALYSAEIAVNISFYHRVTPQLFDLCA